jgi:tRNA threonylcarbamoyl adenosine modification protein (Sua5/YciO/YrdC/YwlC family)
MPEARAINSAAAVAALKRGEVIVFPTETLYGLGADALNSDAVERIYRLKGRNPNMPIPVIVADQAMLGQLVDEISPIARQLMKRFWPGPLTLVLPARLNLPKPLLNAAGGVAVRISSQPIAAQLVQALGRPMTATSANPSGAQPARTLLEAREYFADKIGTFIDGGTLTSRRGSTVLEIQGDHLRIIREGDIAAAVLEQALGIGKLRVEAP